jgi:hypothetical protein
MILVRTDYSCLSVVHHRWYLNIMAIIHRVRSYFQKLTVMIRLDAYIRIIVVLTCDKLTEFYFLYLLSAIYFV